MQQGKLMPAGVVTATSDVMGTYMTVCHIAETTLHNGCVQGPVIPVTFESCQDSSCKWRGLPWTGPQPSWQQLQSTG